MKNSLKVHTHIIKSRKGGESYTRSSWDWWWTYYEISIWWWWWRWWYHSLFYSYLCSFFQDGPISERAVHISLPPFKDNPSYIRLALTLPFKQRGHIPPARPAPSPINQRHLSLSLFTIYEKMKIITMTSGRGLDGSLSLMHVQQVNLVLLTCQLVHYVAMYPIVIDFCDGNWIEIHHDDDDAIQELFIFILLFLCVCVVWLRRRRIVILLVIRGRGNDDDHHHQRTSDLILLTWWGNGEILNSEGTPIIKNYVVLLSRFIHLVVVVVVSTAQM